ncbi:hypothetical protein HanPSC8_Chr16g0734741 [Helianthus annuus]|nr:hypothetical protein HanPSC8_Chr16g0734741 [Helianthus annuus]
MKKDDNMAMSSIHDSVSSLHHLPPSALKLGFRQSQISETCSHLETKSNP